MEHNDDVKDIRALFGRFKTLVLNGTIITATAAEINKLAGVVAGTAQANKAAVLGATKNLDALVVAALTVPDGGLTLNATALARKAAEINSGQMAQEVDFTETDVAGVYTGAITLPNNAVVTDIIWQNGALWTNGTAATMKCGDAGDDDGIFTGVNVKTTPGLGLYLSYQRKDVSVGAYAGTKLLVYPTGGTITFVVTTTGAAGSAGRSKAIVEYYIPPVAAASKV